LDYPDYYANIYDLLKPTVDEGIFNTEAKEEFLKLVDLSLRSAKLPTQLVASFLKRLMRIVISYGHGTS